MYFTKILIFATYILRYEKKKYHFTAKSTKESVDSW